MDSTAAEDAKRARPTASGDGVDLISRLDDDVLLRVLGLVPDARDAARAAALSRRWRSLWPRVPALRFASRPESSGAELCAAHREFISSVNGVLAQRARSGCAIETLSILYNPGLGRSQIQDEIRMEASLVDAVRGWIWHALQHEVKSFELDLSAYYYRLEPHVVLEDLLLPSPVRLETMRLVLNNKYLQLPTTTTMNLASLKELSLESIHIANGGGPLLARLVSSVSCPHLQKLRMNMVWVDRDEEFRIESNMLYELSINGFHVKSLDLRTPRLRILDIDNCHISKVLSVLAPRLEELALIIPLWITVDVIDGDFPCVRSLKLCLRCPHLACGSYDQAENNASMLLLKRCCSVTCLHITLQGEKYSDEYYRSLIKSRVPHLTHITSLTVNVAYDFERHDFGAGVANLLTRFNNLTRLSLHLPFFCSMENNPGGLLGIECYHPDHWTSYEFSMAHLQEVEFTGLTGTECELWFVKAMLASAKRLCKMVIRFNEKCGEHPDKMDAFERMLLDDGMLTSHRDKHFLTCHACMDM